MTTINESFNKADGPTLGPDQTWTIFAGTWATTSNVCVATADNTAAFARCEANLATSDHYVQATLTTIQGATSVFGVLARYSSSQDTMYQALIVVDATGTFSRTQKRINGVDTPIGTDTTETWTAGDVLRLEVSGSTLKRYYNGVLRSTTTDTDITGNVRTGLFYYQKDLGISNSVDNFSAGDLAAAAPGPTPAYAQRSALRW